MSSACHLKAPWNFIFFNIDPQAIKGCSLLTPTGKTEWIENSLSWICHFLPKQNSIVRDPMGLQGEGATIVPLGVVLYSVRKCKPSAHQKLLRFYRKGVLHCLHPCGKLTLRALSLCTHAWTLRLLCEENHLQYHPCHLCVKPWPLGIDEMKF